MCLQKLISRAANCAVRWRLHFSERSYGAPTHGLLKTVEFLALGHFNCSELTAVTIYVFISCISISAYLAYRTVVLNVMFHFRAPLFISNLTWFRNATATLTMHGLSAVERSELHHSVRRHRPCLYGLQHGGDVQCRQLANDAFSRLRFG